MTAHRVKVRLPRNWPRMVRSAVLCVIALARLAVVSAGGRAAQRRNARARLAAENERLRQEAGLLREELRLKDARMLRVPSHRRPHYRPVERMHILELRAARGWSVEQTADVFLLTAVTVASWMRRLDEAGANALVQIRDPVNRFPEFVSHIVQRLKTLCPALGKAKIAAMLARAGLHLAATTVGRMLKEPPTARPAPAAVADATGEPTRAVRADRPNHVWHVDLTCVPTAGGFWTAWLPFALPQRWPFCWRVAVVLDQFSRRVIAFAGFPAPPTSVEARAFLGRAVDTVGTAPKYLVCDKGPQFWCGGFKRWCRRKRIQPRYGAVGQHGSLAVLERFILTLKSTGTRWVLVPFGHDMFRQELGAFIGWYNAHRPHANLDGRTPDEVYFGRPAANRQPRAEPRPNWPRASPCAAPPAPLDGDPGIRLDLDLEFVGGRRHLPIVTLKRAA